MINIRNRRYIGNKASLMKIIKNAINDVQPCDNFSFLDLFAGTGVVSYEFAEEGHPVILNDILYSNYISYQAWFSSQNYDKQKIKMYLDNYNSLNYEDIEDNYFSNIYSDKYFSYNDAKKIGYIRDDIEQNKECLNDREYAILITSLLYAADKIANTVGHFESFLKTKAKDSFFKLEELNLKTFNYAMLYNTDANKLAKEISADVVYLDPPYNARQYINFYHVLENLAKWDKPTEFEGNSMKFKRNHLKSGYSRAIAPKLFEDLINSLNCKVIVVSYNNTYSAQSSASNNKIQEYEILEVLQRKGRVTKKEISYKFFNAGKTNFKEHKEFLFICEVEENAK